jgi:hypothetical protein
MAEMVATRLRGKKPISPLLQTMPRTAIFGCLDSLPLGPRGTRRIHAVHSDAVIPAKPPYVKPGQ